MPELTDDLIDTLDRDVRSVISQLARAADLLDVAIGEHEGDLGSATEAARDKLRAAVATMQGPDFAALESIAAARRG